MNIFFLTIIILSGVILAFLILIQNPKGSGLSGTIIGGFDNNFFGVQKTTNILEKGTWLFATIIGILCLFSSVLLTKSTEENKDLLKEINTSTETTQPLENSPLVPNN